MTRPHAPSVRSRHRLGSTVAIASLVALGIGAGTWHAVAGVATTTTTTLTSPSSPASSAAPVTLTATITPTSPSGSTVPAGTVAFTDGTAVLGTTAVAAGATTATFPANFTKAGSGRHMLTATFTPTATPTAGNSSGTLTQDIMGTNASYVDAAYITMLGHPGDIGGVAYWIDQITNHSVPRSALASALVTVPEYRRNVISGNLNSGSGLDFYNLYLDRSFDAAGADYWVGRMAGVGGAQLTFEQVRLNFAGSPEYFSSALVGKGTAADAIRSLYNDLLPRTDGGASDTTGTNYWNSHYNAAMIASQFLFSPEGRGFLVDTVYHQILNRAAENPGGLPYWSNLLLSGASDENIIASILSSTEYFDSH